MKYIAILTCLLLAQCLFCQKQILVDNNGSVTVHDNLQDAIDAAPSGSYVYVPGGTHVGPITINKPLGLKGAGHHPDSTAATGRTTISGDLQLLEGATQGGIEGFYILGDINFSSSGNPVRNYSIRKTNCDEIHFNYDANNIEVDGCIIRNNIAGGGSGVAFSNTIIHDLISVLTGCSFDQCIFLNGAGTFNTSGVTHSSFTNCIFQTHSITSNEQNVILNCGSGTSGWDGLLVRDTFLIADFSSVFENYTGDIHTYDSDFHLKSNSPAKSKGTNGQDLGIYGGPYPYVEGAVPHGPHIQFSKIAHSNNGHGKLEIEMKVRVQPN